jgi:hypothetical protein
MAQGLSKVATTDRDTAVVVGVGDGLGVGAGTGSDDAVGLGTGLGPPSSSPPHEARRTSVAAPVTSARALTTAPSA